jgi:hypothetical protein
MSTHSSSVVQKWKFCRSSVVQTDGHSSCGVIVCMQAWNVLSNGRSPSLDAPIMESRAAVGDAYQELLGINKLMRRANILHKEVDGSDSDKSGSAHNEKDDNVLCGLRKKIPCFVWHDVSVSFRVANRILVHDVLANV